MSTATTQIRMPEAWQYGIAPPQGALYEYDRELDELRDYVSDSITFARVKNLLRAVDSGDLATTLQFFEEMELKDAHLKGVAGTRRKALTRLDWQLTSAAESQRFRGDKTLADEAAAYCEEQLANLESFAPGMKHLARAIGPNVAAAELVWHGAEIEEIVPIPSQRLTLDPQNFSIIRIIMRDHRDGIPATQPKWIVHSPEAQAGCNWTHSLAHAVAYIYCVKLLAIADWAMFVHRFGVPFLVGRYGAATSEPEKTTLRDVLKNAGTAGWAMFSDAVQLEIVESSQRGTSPQKDLVEWCSRQMSIALLGQALTTDTTGETGTYAAAAVHNMVRQDILEDDIESEAATVRNQILKPLCIYGFPGRDVPYPYFGRVLEEPVDRKQEADVIAAAQAAGLNIPADWAYERLAIPKPKPNEETLEPVNANPFAEEGTL